MARQPVSTQELIGAERIERDAIVTRDGGLRKVLIVSGLNFDLRSEDEQVAAIAGYQNFINSLDFSVQILIHSRKINIEGYLAELDSIRAKEDNVLLAGLIGEYRLFVASLVAHNPIMEKKFFVVVPYDPYSVGPEAAVAKMFSRILGKKAPEGEQETPTGERIGSAGFIKLDERVESAISGLARIGLRAVPLEKAELEELLYNLCNPETIERRGVEVRT